MDYFKNLFNYKSETKIEDIKQNINIEDNQELVKINNNFIGWPTVPELDGFCVANKVLDPDTDRISELDRHPNKQGQRKIMEFLYEKILNSCWL